MKISRRKFFTGSAIAIIGIGAVSLSSGLYDWLYRQLVEEFGNDLAAAAADQGFLEEYIDHLKTERPEDYQLASLYFRLKPTRLSIMKGPEADIKRHLTGLFVRSTNAILALESGEALDYTGIFSPQINPCSNQLSSHFL